MAILFGTNLLKDTFDNEEEWQVKTGDKRRSACLRSDAYPETMKWLEPYE